MEVKQLARLVAALEKTDIAEMRWDEPEWGVTLTRHSEHVPPAGNTPAIGKQRPALTRPLSSSTGEANRTRAPIVVKATMPGFFLDANPFGADTIDTAALRAGGVAVKKEHVLGLLQIGVLLLPVTAPADGTVHACLVERGDAVGYGTPLFEMTDALQAGA